MIAPCPKCGGHAQVRHWQSPYRRIKYCAVECIACGHEGQHRFDEPHQAIAEGRAVESWNKAAAVAA